MYILNKDNRVLVTAAVMRSSIIGKECIFIPGMKSDCSLSPVILKDSDLDDALHLFKSEDETGKNAVVRKNLEEKLFCCISIDGDGSLMPYFFNVHCAVDYNYPFVHTMQSSRSFSGGVAHIAKDYNSPTVEELVTVSKKLSGITPNIESLEYELVWNGTEPMFIKIK